VVDTPQDLTVFGQVVVLSLIQLAGLGYMAVTTVVGLALRRQIRLHERLTLQEALNVQTMDGLARFVLTVLKLTLAFELTGALVLTAWWAGEYGLGRAAYYGIFHAISAFNNAGIALFSDSLVRFRGDWVVNLVVTTLIISGGLGFVVLAEIGRVRRYRHLSTHTRLVITLTATLIVVTTALIWFIEHNNPCTLQPLGQRSTVGVVLSGRHATDGWLQHARHRCHAARESVPLHPADVHRCCARGNRRRSEDQHVQHHGRGDLGDGARHT
jgi:trk system potassium uptake protein TrkH